MVIIMSNFHKAKSLALASAFLITTLVSTAMGGESLQKYSEELRVIAREVSPSVVTIHISGRDNDPPEPRREPGDSPEIQRFFKEWHWPGDKPLEFLEKNEELQRLFMLPRSAREASRSGMGTGIIMDAEGHIVTVSHLVKDLRGKIKVRLADNREFEAKLVGADPDSGVAVIKIDAKDLTPARPGNSDKLEIAEPVLAFGNMRGMGISVTSGIVSAVGRTDLKVVAYGDLIQTDATVGPGSGGGPLVNVQGQVIGMIIALATDTPGSDPSGIGFAVPINTVVRIMGDLIEKGKVTRGWLGVQIQEVSSDLAEKLGLEKPRGVVVGAVGGPAREGGIETGDVIVKFDGETVKNTIHLRNMVARTEPGREVDVVVMRNGQEKEVTVKIGDRTEASIADLGGRSEPASREVGWMGITVQELTGDLAREFGYVDEEGVLVSNVREGSPADRKGLRKGDLIQEVENRSIKNIRDYEEAVKDAEDTILVRVKRDERVWYEVIKRKGNDE
jgi:serine protease Do